MSDLWSSEARTKRAVCGSWNGPVSGYVPRLRRLALLAEGFEPWSWASLPGLGTEPYQDYTAPGIKSERWPTTFICNQCGGADAWHVYNLCEDRR